MRAEGEIKELQEDVVIDALLFAHQAVQPLIELQERPRVSHGKEKRPFTPPRADAARAAKVKAFVWDRLATAMTTKDKKLRRDALSQLHADVRTELTAEG